MRRSRSYLRSSAVTAVYLCFSLRGKKQQEHSGVLFPSRCLALLSFRVCGRFSDSDPAKALMAQTIEFKWKASQGSIRNDKLHFPTQETLRRHKTNSLFKSNSTLFHSCSDKLRLNSQIVDIDPLVDYQYAALHVPTI